MGFILCRIQSGVMDKHSFNRRVLYLLFLDSLIFLHSLGGDGRGRFGGVVLLNVSCGSGDGSPSLATTDADGYGGECDCAKQNNCQ